MDYGAAFDVELRKKNGGEVMNGDGAFYGFW